MQILFGTDGIRGRANDSITSEVALQIGQAAGLLFRRGVHRHRVVVGKDTRLSCYMIEMAMVAGFTSVGMDVLLVGPMPTPAVSMLTRTMRADLGVMISASHNPYEYNGIKLFGPDGRKLDRAIEVKIEELVASGLSDHLATSEDLGRVRRIEGVQDRYIEFLKRTLPGLSLEGLRIVVDCAHGAAYHVAPNILWELGADVIPIAVKPDGTNINKECGSTDPRLLSSEVRRLRADVGIALDGDADRVLISDEQGHVIDSDQVLAVIAESWRSDGKLTKPGVVATILSNLGFERWLAQIGLSLIRTQVGDQHLIECMRTQGYNLGGEPSGHIILSDYPTTSDGLAAGLQVLACARQTGLPISELCCRFEPVPQVRRNVPYDGGQPHLSPQVQQVINDAERQLKGQGRVVVRPSGTEPVIRVMVEGGDEGLIEVIVDTIVDALERTIV